MEASYRLFLSLVLVAGLALAGCVAPAATPDELAPASPGGAESSSGRDGVFHYAVSLGEGEDFAGTEAAAAPLSVAPSMTAVGTMRHGAFASFEPTVGITSDGTVLLSAYQDVYVNGIRSKLLQRSDDNGLTWKDVTPVLVTGVASFPTQSNDPYVHVDPDTDRVFLSDLQALVCSTLSFSDDKGETWTRNPIGCGHPVGGQDHQTVFTARPRATTTEGYPNLVYYCVNRVVDTACATSTNGGVTFGALIPVMTGSGLAPGIGGYIACGGLTGHGVGGPDGRVYIARSLCGKPVVASSADDGLTWTVSLVSAFSPVMDHEVNVAVDEAGNVYTFWIGADALPYLAVSKDGGKKWSKPMMVGAPGVGTTDFPTLAAGADGRIAFAYLGTSRVAGYGDMTANDTWNAYIGIVTDATAATPLVQTVMVNSDPVARGVCGGSRCSGQGDFIDIQIDHEGRPWMAFVDVCRNACLQPGATSNAAPLGAVGTLATGPSLRGELVPLPPLDG